MGDDLWFLYQRAMSGLDFLYQKALFDVNFYRRLGIKVSNHTLTNEEGQAIITRVWEEMLKWR